MHKCNKEADIKHIQWLHFLKPVEFVGVAWPGLILMKLKPHVPWSANEKQFPLFWRQWIYSWNLFLPSFTYQNGEHHTNTKANNKSFDPCWPAQGSCIRYLVKNNNIIVKGLNPGVISKVGWVWSSRWTKSWSQDYIHPGDQTQPTFEIILLLSPERWFWHLSL